MRLGVAAVLQERRAAAKRRARLRTGAFGRTRKGRVYVSVEAPRAEKDEPNRTRRHTPRPRKARKGAGGIWSRASVSALRFGRGAAHLCHRDRRGGRADAGGVPRLHLEHRVSRVASAGCDLPSPRSPKRLAKKCLNSPSPRLLKSRARQPARPAAFSARATSRSGHPRRWRVPPLTRRRALPEGAEPTTRNRP